MPKPKLIRITTIPLSLEKLLEGQLAFMNQYYEVIAVSSENERLEAYGRTEGVSTFHVSMTRKITPFRDFKAVLKLYRFLCSEKPQIVHTHTPKAGIIGMLAARMAGIPHRLHTVAGLPLLEVSGAKRGLLNFVEKLTYRFATKVYPNSKGLYDIIIEKGFTKQNKLKIIGQGSSNGIDTAYFNSKLFSEDILVQKRKESNIPTEDFVFIFVGRLVKDKGINELVSAFSTLQKQFSNTTLLLVGPFEDFLDPVSKATKRMISENAKIITTGYQDDVRIFYAMSDVLVFPSYREGFPNVVLQAGAMGLPAIVTDINGCNEIIVENKNGLIIPIKDEKALLEAMQRLLNDKKLYNELQLNARSMINAGFKQKEVWEALLKEYRMLENNL